MVRHHVGEEQGKGKGDKKAQPDAKDEDDPIFPTHRSLEFGLIRVHICDEAFQVRNSALVFRLLGSHCRFYVVELCVQRLDLGILLLQFRGCHRVRRVGEAEQGIHGQAEVLAKGRNFKNTGLFILTRVKALEVIQSNAGGIGDLLIGFAFFIFLVSHHMEQGVAMRLEIGENGTFFELVHGLTPKTDEMFFMGGRCEFRTRKRVKITLKKTVFALDEWSSICYIERRKHSIAIR